MVKIVLASDNHGNRAVLDYILFNEQDGDYYLHCGDSKMYPDELRPFISVKGNVDSYVLYKDELLLNIDNKKIMLIHGHRYHVEENLNELVQHAQGRADLVFYGHTHIFNNEIKQGIYFINPGSASHNRDNTAPSYALVYIDNNKIRVVRKDILI